MNLSKNVKIDQILGYFAAGTTKRTSAILDMKGYEGVLFVAGLGTIIENGTIDVYPEQNTSDSTVGMAEQAGTAAYTVTAAAAALTYSCIIVDIYKPLERYIQCNITPAVSNAVILGIVAIRYKGKMGPEAMTTPYPLKATMLVSPSEE
uniref:Uncharacterized protein n=1 Tax=viral metagenome TaxID=1070528 RepID=A0A6M3L3H8_9ZZZZ